MHADEGCIFVVGERETASERTVRVTVILDPRKKSKKKVLLDQSRSTTTVCTQYTHKGPHTTTQPVACYLYRGTPTLQYNSQLSGGNSEGFFGLLFVARQGFRCGG